MLTFPAPSGNSDSPYGIYNIWNAASVILGFQFTAFIWRMTREREMARYDGGKTWFPFADKLNLASMFVNIVGVFLAPILGWTSIHPAGALVISLTLFAIYPFALVGHYKLFCKHWVDSDYLPRQEKCFVAGAFVFVVLLTIHFREPSYIPLVLSGAGVSATVILVYKRRKEKKKEASMPLLLW